MSSLLAGSGKFLFGKLIPILRVSTDATIFCFKKFEFFGFQPMQLCFVCRSIVSPLLYEFFKGITGDYVLYFMVMCCCCAISVALIIELPFETKDQSLTSDFTEAASSRSPSTNEAKQAYGTFMRDPMRPMAQGSDV